MRAASLFPLFLPLSLLIAGCRDNSWSTAQGKLAVAMGPVTNAIDEEGLPPCPAAAFADGKPMILTDIEALRLASASDAYLATNRKNHPLACVSFGSSREVSGALNTFNQESFRVADARKILAAKKFGVVATDMHHAATASGGGKTAGRIVLVVQGKAVCATPWSAENGETTTVQVDKITRLASDEARKNAWTGDLDSRSCRAIEALLPRTRN